MAILFIPPTDWVSPRYEWEGGEQFAHTNYAFDQVVENQKVNPTPGREFLIFDIYFQGF